MCAFIRCLRINITVHHNLLAKGLCPPFSLNPHPLSTTLPPSPLHRSLAMTAAASRLLLLLPVSKALLTTPCTRPASTARRSFSPRGLAEIHPAVAGWPDKYSGTLGGPKGPRILHDAFAVQTGDTSLLMELDVANWPTWTTAGNERWLENVTRKDKEMPYGELSYLISGKLEIVPKATGVPVIVSPGDFVTFPEGFVSDWTVLEELTWHYFLY